MSASVLPVLVRVEEEVHRELPLSPLGFGLIALGVFLLLLAVLWSFRGTAYKVRDRHNAARGLHH